ncbi:glycosyl hydrolase family 18 protein [Paenibacillus turpanensis]|uniref:glycosyl hydrolase family 18 protein n=1 Tax=Paenibacillus turpanensis TaxID=2689078 RepID=UPI001408A9E4|nr:glycosyl hydrolase family 18 protein [Paenibacillus turpanensis]
MSGFIAYWAFLAENNTKTGPQFEGLTQPVFYQGSIVGESAIGSGEALKIPVETVKELLDPAILYEEASDSVIITSKDKVIRLRTDQLEAAVNGVPFTLRFPVEKQGSTVYVPAQPLIEVYGAKFIQTDSGAVILHKQGDALQYGTIVSGSRKSDGKRAVRSAQGRQFPIVSEVDSSERHYIWGEKDGWYFVQSERTGIQGYVDKRFFTLGERKVEPLRQEKQAFTPWKPIGGKINATWEHVVSRNPDTRKIGEMPGLNVISPTWFHIADGDGNLKNMADSAYVKWAHDRGYKVWALFSNSFEPKITAEALKTYDKRMHMIRQLVSFAGLYKLDGINIDFENVYLENKDELTQFVRELTPLMHEQGLVVSIDVTFKSTNEMWSMFYDREALAEVVDFMMVMAYDEHWATSPKSGSVASLPWVEKGIVRIMEEDNVPASKLILGIPFYTRVWTEKLEDGKTKVSSKAVTMDAVKRLMEERKLTPVYKEEAGQDYIEFKDGDTLQRVWIENEASIRKRVELVHKYGLAGVATWRRGFERPEIWNTIQDELKIKP